MSVARSCDLCDRPEAPGRFVQHYTLMPGRQVGASGYQPRGRRGLDLCGECAETWTHPVGTVQSKPATPAAVR